MLFRSVEICTQTLFQVGLGASSDEQAMAELRPTVEKDIKKRWQEHTEELYKKELHDPDNHDGVVTYLELDILGCEVKWALGSITTNKANGSDGIPVELFQILKDDAVKVLHSIYTHTHTHTPANLENSAVATGLEKGQFSFQSQRKAMPKNAQTTAQLHSSHHCFHIYFP